MASSNASPSASIPAYAAWPLCPRRTTARLNRIHHLLSQIPYEDVELPLVELPQRMHHKDYLRAPTPADLMVPEVY